MGTVLRRFARCEAGMEAVEYGIIAGLIVAGTVASIAAIGLWMTGTYDLIKTRLGI